jgi:hypothetical protein
VIIVIAVTHIGLYPIGADNPPGRLERTLAGRAMDVYADKHKPAGDNPIAPTAANLTQGALQAVRAALRVVSRRRGREPVTAAADNSRPRALRRDSRSPSPGGPTVASR